MHKIELRKGFSGDRRNRAGISVTRIEPVQAELTDEQLKAIQADPELVVTQITSKGQEATKEDAPRKMVDKPKGKKG